MLVGFFRFREGKTVSPSHSEQPVQRHGVGVQLVRAVVLHHRNMARGRRRHRRQRVRTFQRVQGDGHGRRLWQSETVRVPGQATKGIVVVFE